MRLAYADTVPLLGPDVLEERSRPAAEVRWLCEHFGDLLARVLGHDVDALRFEVASMPRVDDGCTVLRLLDPSGRPLAVAHLSSPEHPQMVDRQLKGAALAREVLGPQLGDHLLEPLAHARRQGRSCALLPYCRPLHRGLLRRLDSLRVEAAVLPWLREVTRATQLPAANEGTARRFRERLERMSSLSVLPAALRRASDAALARLASGAWQPRHVLMHADLWRENILLRPPDRSRRRRFADRFVVIDWPGVERQGYALFDLVRLALSLGLSPARLAREVQHHADALEADRVDAAGYLLAGLGHVALRLGHFPLERFASMAADCHAALRLAGCAD